MKDARSSFLPKHNKGITTLSAEHLHPRTENNTYLHVQLILNQRESAKNACNPLTVNVKKDFC